VSIKQNIPLLVLAALLVGLVVALVVLRPPEQDRIRAAAEAYAQSLGSVRRMEIHGTVADIEIADHPIVFAEFIKRDGKWEFSRDLGQEFERAMKDPALQKAILERLGQRIADRFLETVTVKELMKYEFHVAREESGLVGLVNVPFSYPSGKSGRYLETFQYENGSWANFKSPRSDAAQGTPGSVLPRTGRVPRGDGPGGSRALAHV